MTVWDVSGFVGAWGYWPLKERTAADVIALMDSHGIECAVVGSTRALQSDWRLGNDEILQAAAASDGRLIPFVTIDSTQPGNTDLLSDYADSGARGVRCYPSMHSNTLPQQLEPLCAAAEASGLIVTLVVRAIMDWSFPVAVHWRLRIPLCPIPGCTIRAPWTELWRRVLEWHSSAERQSKPLAGDLMPSGPRRHCAIGLSG